MCDSCVYKNRNNGTCGNEPACKGCYYDPNESSMTYEEFREEQYHWNCDSCVYCRPNADMDGVDSICKRLDHKKYNFAKAVFYSYDCGQRNGFLCSDYKPKASRVWLFNHYKKEFLDQFGKNIKENAMVGICLFHDWSVRYQVKAKDFFYGNFIDKDGNLKWIKKGYSKQSRNSTTGWKYVYEYPDGNKQEGANSPIKQNTNGE